MARSGTLIKECRVLWVPIVLLGLSACGGEESAQQEGLESETEVAHEASLSRDFTALRGEWRVVGHHSPGISALSDDEAEAWHGARLRIGEGWLAMGEHYCETVSHVGEVLPVNQILDDYRLAADSLAPLTEREQVARHRLDCDDGDWPVLGSQVLRLSDTQALAPWDGVFFELERDEGFRATGTEPAWNLALSDQGMRFAVPFDDRDVRAPLPVPEKGSDSDSRIYHARLPGGYLRVVITTEDCRDSMSGAPYETSVRVTHDSEAFEGCGGSMPTFEP